MAAPTNISAATAIDLGTSYGLLATQNVHDAGTTYAVWYKRTARVGEVALSVWGFGDLVGYAPICKVYIGPDSSPVPYPAVEQALGTNVPIQFPVTPGETYYFEFSVGGNPSPASLTVTLTRAPTALALARDLLINDDAGTNLAAIIVGDATDPADAVRRFVKDFPSGEEGDVFPSTGRLIFTDEFDGEDQNLKIYTPSLALLTTAIAPWVGTPRLRMNIQTDTAWFGFTGAGAVNASVRAISASGSVGVAHELPTTGLVALATSPDESILYHSGQGGSVGAAIKRWDLGSDIALSDLVAGVANYSVADLLVMDDGSIVAVYFKSTVTRDAFMRVFAPDGSTLGTYQLGPGSGNYTVTKPRTGYGLTAGTVVVMYHVDTPSGYTYIDEIRVSDGEVLSSVPVMTFESSAYQGDPTATPDAFYGASFSCPIVALRRSVVTTPIFDESAPCCDSGCDCDTPHTTTTGNPGTPTIPRATGPVLPPIDPSWTPNCVGGGGVPSAADAVDAESWVS